MTNLERLIKKDPKMITEMVADESCVNTETLEIEYFRGDCDNCRFHVENKDGHFESCWIQMRDWLLEEVKE